MEYDYTDIGEKIRKNRKEAKISQEELCEQLHIGRNSLSNIENGNSEKLTLEHLIKLSAIFHCDIGYFLGEYDNRRVDHAYITETTGLSDNAIIHLMAMMQTDSAPGNLNNQSINTLNNLLCSKHFAQFLEQFKDYLNCDYSVPVYRTSPGTPDMEVQSADYNPNAGLYMMHLAKSAANPTDYKTFAITPNFMEAITKNEINETLSRLKNDINKKRPSRE